MSRAHLSSHIHGYQSDLDLQILPESPQIYNSMVPRRHRPYTGSEGKSPQTLAQARNEKPLPQPRAWHHGAVTLQGCSSGAMPEPPGAVVCLRQFNSRKPKGAYAEGQEGMGEAGLWSSEQVVMPRNNHKADFAGGVLFPMG